MQGPSHNPFAAVAKADSHSPADVASLFVQDASPIWVELQCPVNHIVVGARGAGKTMALRQLDYRTAASGDQDPEFIGVYIHVSRISAFFHVLFADRDENSEQPLIRQFQQVFADYLSLEIVRGICDLADEDNQLARPDFSEVFRLPKGFDFHDIAHNCARLQLHAETSIQSWQISNRCAWQPLGDLPTSMARLARALRRANSWLVRDRPCLYLLLDESSPVPSPCQVVLNSLLQRGEPYCAKLAVRPFEWRTLNTPSGQPREQNTDVFVLHLNHPNELGASYISRMERVVGKVLARRGSAVAGIRSALPSSEDYPYSGFDAICAASSGNPQNLLLICSAIFAATGCPDGSIGQGFASVSPSVQHDVVRTWSRDFGSQNGYDASRRLCRSLALEVKRAPQANRSIGFEYRTDEPDLFTDGSLPDDLAEPLRPAFAGGFVLAGEDTHASLFDVPVSFRLSRGALPELDVPIDTPTAPPVPLDRRFIKSRARAGQAHGAAHSIPEPVVYLSSSFIDRSDSRWESVTQALLNAGFSFPKVRPTVRPATWFDSARRKIAKANVAILGGQAEMFRTMFELGLCAGASHPVHVIVGRLDQNETPFQTKEELQSLSSVSQQDDEGNYSRFAAEVRAVAKQLWAGPSDFANVSLTGVSLRPKRRRERTLYLSLPEIVGDQILQNEIRVRLATKGWSMITEDEMMSYSANALQVPVLCAYTARIGVIDTSAAKGLDLMQGYKLGLFVGKRGWRVLHTSKMEPATPSLLDRAVGAECFRWEDGAELVERILRFVRA